MVKNTKSEGKGDRKVSLRESTPDGGFMVFNLRGTQFQLEKSLLLSFPTKSGFATYLSQNYGFSLEDLCTNRVQIDKIYLSRNPNMFHYVIDFLQNGALHFPQNLCCDVIASEMQFWGFPEKALSRCCWDRLAEEVSVEKEHRAVARKWRWLEAKRKRVAETLPGGTKSFKTPIREKIRLFFEDSGSSVFAKVWAIFMTIVIIASLGTLILETELSLRSPPYEEVIAQTNITKGNGLIEYYTVNSVAAVWVSYMDSLCLIILSFEYIMRFIVSYRKCLFLLHPLNITDLLGILPMWFLIGVQIYRESGQIFHESIEKAITLMAILRLFRILRFVRLMTYSKQLKIVYLAVMTSYRQIIILAALMSLLSITFGSIMYYAEMSIDNFESILIGQWWAIVTMTTVGYGDYYPKTVVGYVTGVLCSLTGIVHIALATTVIVNNFITTNDGVDAYIRRRRRDNTHDDKAIRLWGDPDVEEDEEEGEGEEAESKEGASSSSINIGSKSSLNESEGPVKKSKSSNSVSPQDV